MQIFISILFVGLTYMNLAADFMHVKNLNHAYRLCIGKWETGNIFPLADYVGVHFKINSLWPAVYEISH